MKKTESASKSPYIVLRRIKAEVDKWLKKRTEYFAQIELNSVKSFIRIELANSRKIRFTELQIEEFCNFINSLILQFGIRPSVEEKNELKMVWKLTTA